MEVKRKKITDEEIFETEKKLSERAKELRERYESDFSALGYELELEFGQKEDEAENNYEELSTEENKQFETGYVSHAVLTVKRKKTEEEIVEEERLAEENRAAFEAAETPEEAEQLENDETLRVSEGELKRSVAFTEIMLVRVYKAFWTEWVSLGESLSEAEADLCEFLDSLRQRAAE